MTNKLQPEKDQKLLKVVIVDDDEDLLKMMTYAFQAQEFDVEVFNCGKDALDYLSDTNHLASTQLLILDRLLPDMDGLEILQELSKKYQKKMPVVLILSILDSEKDILKGLGMGAIDYLSKPFNLNILMDKTRSLLSNYIQ